MIKSLPLLLLAVACPSFAIVSGAMRTVGSQDVFNRLAKPTATVGPFATAAGPVSSITFGDLTFQTAGAITVANGGMSVDDGGLSNFTVNFATGVNSFGFVVQEPSVGCTPGPCVDSTFQVRAWFGAFQLFERTFNVKNDEPAFFGVWTKAPMTRLEIREVTPGNEREYFVQFFTGRTPLNAQALLIDLLTMVAQLNSSAGIANALDAKLEWLLRAMDSLNHGDGRAALSQLDAFIHNVRAQRGMQIPADLADAMIAEAELVKTLIL